jgi:hypothetical protein
LEGETRSSNEDALLTPRHGNPTGSARS